MCLFTTMIITDYMFLNIITLKISFSISIPTFAPKPFYLSIFSTKFLNSSSDFFLFFGECNIKYYKPLHYLKKNSVL